MVPILLFLYLSLFFIKDESENVIVQDVIFIYGQCICMHGRATFETLAFGVQPAFPHFKTNLYISRKLCFHIYTYSCRIAFELIFCFGAYI